MKTKLTFLTVLSFVVITMMMWTNSAQAQCMFPLTNPSTYDTTVYINICNTVCTNVTLQAPIGQNGTWWISAPNTHTDPGNIIVINNTNNGSISWVSNLHTINIEFYIQDYLSSSIWADTIYTCGTLDAGINPGGTFLWNNGQISQTIWTTSPGIYYVEKNNACGSISDTTEILWGSTPVNIGHDTTLCYGLSLPLNAGGGTSWLWFNGATTQTTTVDSTNICWVAATANGCTVYDSLNATFTINTGENIQIVTTDTMAGNNEIRWTDLKPNMVSTLIYRMDTNTYYLQAVVPYNQKVFIDTLSSINHPWRYKISTLDGCGNESVKSAYHQSISLGVVPLVPSGFRLEWTPYSIEGLFKLFKSFTISYYSIYSTNGYGGSWNPTPITTVGASITELNLPFSVDSFYGVEAGINTAKTIISTKSNLVYNPTITGIKDMADITPSIYPNPVVGNFLYVAGIPGIKHIEIYDIQGKIVYSEEYSQARINIPNLATGSYMCIISTEKCLYTTKFQRK